VPTLRKPYGKVAFFKTRMLDRLVPRFSVDVDQKGGPDFWGETWFGGIGSGLGTGMGEEV